MLREKEYKYRYGEYVHITFDKNGYITEAKGFDTIVWDYDVKINETLIGKTVDELAEILKERCITREIYLEFEATIHVEVLKNMLKNTAK